MELNLLIALSGIVGAGISSYVGVRVAMAEMRGDLKRHEGAITDLKDRVHRLERPYFKQDE